MIPVDTQELVDVEDDLISLPRWELNFTSFSYLSKFLYIYRHIYIYTYISDLSTLFQNIYIYI